MLLYKVIHSLYTYLSWIVLFSIALGLLPGGWFAGHLLNHILDLDSRLLAWLAAGGAGLVVMSLVSGVSMVLLGGVYRGWRRLREGRIPEGDVTAWREPGEGDR